MAELGTVLGFYQDPLSSAEAARELGRVGLCRRATIHRHRGWAGGRRGPRACRPMPADRSRFWRVDARPHCAVWLVAASPLLLVVSLPVAAVAAAAMWSPWRACSTPASQGR